MHRVGWKIFAVKWMTLFAIFSVMLLNACDNSAEADADETTSSLQSSGSKAKSSSSKKAYPDSFKPNDKEYPYANIPRIVIYTENQQEIKDRETEIPAKLQIWGKKEAETEIFDLTIRGRGNSSWKIMPKKSYKIEFEKKQAVLGMPKDKDWALIANYADKTLMKNFIAYRLSAALGAYYAPRCEFAELYLNGEYLGVYLLTETIKVGKNRVNIFQSDSSYIVEFDAKYRENEQVVFSDVLTEDGIGKAFRIHNPKNATETSLGFLQDNIQKFEKFLKSIENGRNNKIDVWIDVDESIKHYWVQEITKNPDAGFYTSVFFSWVKGGKIKLGPVWDFDIAFGNSVDQSLNTYKSFIIRNCYWNKYLFRDSLYKKTVDDFWKRNKSLVVDFLDSIETVQEKLRLPAQNNFIRWRILEDTTAQWHPKFYKKYDDAVDDLKEWLSERIQWIGSEIKK
jgi:hypothetical protein